MKLRLAFIAMLVFALSAMTSAAQAATVKDSFAYQIGNGAPLEGHPSAVAENGDTVTVDGAGTFDVTAKTATGGGTFTHRAADGTVRATGTWTATGLLAFQSYGDATPQGLPAFLFGGRASLAVTLTPAGTTFAFPGILEVECVLGTPPAGAEEGVRLLVKGHINFNKTVEESGQTVFVRL